MSGRDYDGVTMSTRMLHIPKTTVDQRVQAARTLASAAVDAIELAGWLDMLGLDAKEGR